MISSSCSHVILQRSLHAAVNVGSKRHEGWKGRVDGGMMYTHGSNTGGRHWSNKVNPGGTHVGQHLHLPSVAEDGEKWKLQNV